MSLKSAISLLFLATLVYSVVAACSGKYTYVLNFDFNWSFETDRAFPNKSPLTKPSFSELICASHSPNYTMWQPGKILSKSMIDFIGEEVSFTKLRDELVAAEERQIVRSFNITSEGSPSLGELTSFLRITPNHTLISCASRIDPSPSWFIGISSLDMCQNNTFRKAHDLVILGWWGGLDEAEDYTATQPIKPGETPFKVRRRIDVAPFGYGTLFISRQNANIPFTSPVDPGANAQRTNGPRIVPAAEAICVGANALQHLPPEDLLFPTHRHAYVLCDPFNSCATPGHIVVYQGQPMMMKSYCQFESICERRLMLVNSPKYSRAMRIDSATHNLKFTAFAARFSTRTEEGVLSLAVRMGL